MGRPEGLPTASGNFPIDRYASYVYRVYDRKGQLLYVGVTDDLAQRIQGHRRGGSLWLKDAVRVEWEQFLSRVDAERAETKYIVEQFPRDNVQGNSLRFVADGMGHRAAYPRAAWRRLGQAVRQEREAARRTQKSLAAALGITVQALRDFEAGRTPGAEPDQPVEYERTFLGALESQLSWRAGSLEAVLADGEPSRLTEDELVARAHANHRSLALGDRI